MPVPFRPAGVTLLLALLCALPACADAISDSIAAAQSAYAAGDLKKAGEDLRSAQAQLQAMQGRTVRFHTAVCVKRAATGFEETDVRTVAVRFRALSDEAIETYLRLEQPYDCAGSAKCEGLGIALLERIDSDDPTTLVGLPLIATTGLLYAAGLDVLHRPHLF